MKGLVGRVGRVGLAAVLLMSGTPSGVRAPEAMTMLLVTPADRSAFSLNPPSVVFVSASNAYTVLFSVATITTLCKPLPAMWTLGTNRGCP